MYPQCGWQGIEGSCFLSLCKFSKPQASTDIKQSGRKINKQIHIEMGDKKGKEDLVFAPLCLSQSFFREGLFHFLTTRSLLFSFAFVFSYRALPIVSSNVCTVSSSFQYIFPPLHHFPPPRSHHLTNLISLLTDDISVLVGQVVVSCDSDY